MSLAYAANDIATAAASRQLTGWFALLLALLFLVMMGIALWSWVNRYQLDVKRRSSASALRATQSRLTQLSNQLPVVLFSFVSRQGFDMVSDGTLRLLSIGAEDLLTDSVQLLNCIEDQDREGLEWLSRQQDCPANLDWVGRIKRADGTSNSAVPWLQIRADTEIDAAGRRVFTGVIVDVTSLKNTQHALEASREELRRLAIHRELKREQEYRHLAREFHDELGQVLTSARMHLQLLDKRLAEDAESHAAIEQLDAMISDAYRSVKSIASELRPPALNLGLAAAIEWQAERVLTPAGVKFTVAVASEVETLPDLVATALFRIVQEAFTNSLRHAKAASIHVSVRHTAEGLYLSVADDGCGFDVAAVNATEHFGLIGMRERVCALGGVLDIDSALGEGTRLSVVLPPRITKEFHGEATS